MLCSIWSCWNRLLIATRRTAETTCQARQVHFIINTSLSCRYGKVSTPLDCSLGETKNVNCSDFVMTLSITGRERSYVIDSLNSKLSIKKKTRWHFHLGTCTCTHVHRDSHLHGENYISLMCVVSVSVVEYLQRESDAFLVSTVILLHILAFSEICFVLSPTSAGQKWENQLVLFFNSG